MGYYTAFELQVRRYPDPETPAPREDVDAISEAVAALGVLEAAGDGLGWSGFAKWYECDLDMCSLSARFPDYLFTIFGDGEQREDIWRGYYYRGRVQICRPRITWDAFDPDRTRPPGRDCEDD
ncbi:MAG: hypothetical protein LUC17_05230 [Oscillospiraceae bacterium]|nr:hypothetical protein [Oscillospiraceae bacterium]